MPALPVIPATYLVTQHWHDTNQLHDMVNRFCVHDFPGTGSPLTIATRVAQRFASDLMPTAHTDIGQGVTDIIPLDGISPTETFATIYVGTAGGHAGGQAMPLALSCVAAWQTNTKGRSHRGRSFLFPPSDDEVVHFQTGNLTGAAITARQTAYDAFVADLKAAGPGQCELMVLSRKLGSTSAVSRTRADAVVHIQRRRYERVARH